MLPRCNSILPHFRSGHTTLNLPVVEGTVMETITEADIREKLSDHYGGDNSSRRFVKNEREDSHGSVGSVVYSLSGSPPKGYAIAIPGLRMVNFYDNRGKRFKIMRDTVVDELE